MAASEVAGVALGAPGERVKYGSEETACQPQQAWRRTRGTPSYGFALKKQDRQDAKKENAFCFSWRLGGSSSLIECGAV
jgi:hypothetical protein